MTRADLNTGTWKKLRKIVLDRDMHSCHYCGKPATTCDHVIAAANGGETTLDNLVAACSHCNYSKGSKHFFEPSATRSQPVANLSPTTRSDRGVTVVNRSND
jgi:5-methylcytosine-specific restriction endonuclease McrA